MRGAEMLSQNDVLRINNLVVQSEMALDEGNVEAWLSGFAPAGMMKVTDASGVRSWSSRPELISFEFAAASSAFNRGCVRRFLNSILIDEIPDGATLSALFMVVSKGAAPAVLASGTHQDRLVRSGDKWRFVERHAILDVASDVGVIDALRGSVALQRANRTVAAPLT